MKFFIKIIDSLSEFEFSKIQDFFKKTTTQIVLALLLGSLIGFIAYPIIPDSLKYITYDISYSIQSFIFPENYKEPQWIGARIEFITRGKVGFSNIETDIIQTDKQGGENLILKNDDQHLEKIHLGSKFNSLDFIVWLRRYKNKKEPVCLLTYGERQPRNSQLKNILKINSFPSDKDIEYDKLLPSERDNLCKNYEFRQRSNIISPRS